MAILCPVASTTAQGHAIRAYVGPVKSMSKLDATVARSCKTYYAVIARSLSIVSSRPTLTIKRLSLMLGSAHLHVLAPVVAILIAISTNVAKNATNRTSTLPIVHYRSTSLLHVLAARRHCLSYSTHHGLSVPTRYQIVKSDVQNH